MESLLAAHDNFEPLSSTFKSVVGSWVSSLQLDLLWMTFLIEGHANHCLQNPDLPYAEPLGLSELKSILQEASAIVPLLCPNGNGRVVMVRRKLQYISFWTNSQPWLVIGVSNSITPKRLMAAIDASQRTETEVGSASVL